MLRPRFIHCTHGFLLAAALAAPTLHAAAPGPLPMGRWDCRDEITGPLRMMGYFTLSADGGYRYLNKPGKEGRYRYDAPTGMIEWLSGPYGKGADGTSYRTFYAKNSAGTPMVTMRLVQPDGKYADADYCFLNPRG